MLDIAQAIEASESQSRQIAEDNQFTNVYSINRQTRGGKGGQRKRQNLSKSKEKQCSRCGIKGHSCDDCHCSRNVTCFKCGNPGILHRYVAARLHKVVKQTWTHNVDVILNKEMLKESPVVTVYTMLMSKLCHRCVSHSDQRTLTVMMPTPMNTPSQSNVTRAPFLLKSVVFPLE